MSPTKLVDGERVEITEAEAQEAQATWEYYRGAADEPLGRKVTPGGTVLESDVPVDEAQVRAVEHKRVRESIDRQAAISKALNSAPGKEIISLLVDTGVLSVADAEAAGWTP